MPDRSWKELQADADAHLKKGEVGRAAHTLIAAIDLAPQQPELYVQLVKVALLAGGTQTAVEAATRLVALEPQNADSHYLHAIACLAHGTADDAKRSLEESLRLAPRSWQARQALAQVLVLLKEPAQARQLLEEAVRLAPQEPAPANELAVLLLGADQAQAAKDLLVPIARANPYDAGVHLNLALAAAKIGDTALMKSAAATALKHAQDDASIREQAQRLLALGQPV